MGMPTSGTQLPRQPMLSQRRRCHVLSLSQTVAICAAFLAQPLAARHAAETVSNPIHTCTSEGGEEDLFSQTFLLQTSLTLATPGKEIRPATLPHIAHASILTNLARVPSTGFHHSPQAKVKATSNPVSLGGPVIMFEPHSVSRKDKMMTNPTGYLYAARHLIYFGFVVFALLGLTDWYRFACLRATETREAGAAALLGASGNVSEKVVVDKAKELPEWSLLGLVSLTSFRFYTGFLSATWLPYLLAMEGADLYTENQSLFMGVAKLIYGLTILTNPLFGLLGDRAVALSHGIGRRLFLRAGIVIAGCGIIICVLADIYRYFYCFVFGIILWRVGEALNDVTTEALVPELVPPQQYAIASAAKAASFLFGGVFAYVLLIFMSGYHYTWLYWAYAAGMLLFAIPCQVLLSSDLPMRQAHRADRQTGPFKGTLFQAYVAPAFIEGRFPQLCFGIFIFSFGTSPMFFLLLMIRDLVGASSLEQLQRNFSVGSIIFFISAAVATILGGMSDKYNNISSNRQNTSTMPSPNVSLRIQDPEVLISRLQTVVKVGVAYAACCIVLPAICLLELHTSRILLFNVFAVVLGLSFGSGFARFQDITWQLIPPGVDVANAMGFNIMCRLFGVGIGNFIAGAFLEYFELKAMKGNALGGDESIPAEVRPVYAPMGYVVMCIMCAGVCLTSSWICNDIAKGVRRDLKDSPVPAA